LASQFIAASSASYSGVDVAGTPFGTPVTAGVDSSSSPFTITVTSATGELVVDTCFAKASATGVSLTPGTGETLRSHANDNTVTGNVEGQFEKAGAASVVLAHTDVSGNLIWGMCGVSLKPAGGGANWLKEGYWWNRESNLGL
jgi:hypothetical protein